MSFVAIVPVDFALPQAVVFKALIDLSTHPHWSSGMMSISHTEPMYVGLTYSTTSKVLGRINKAEVKVIELTPPGSITLANTTGLIEFTDQFLIKPRSAQSCTVECTLQFKFNSSVLNLAQPVVEAVAESRIQGDLERLRDLLVNSK